MVKQNFLQKYQVLISGIASALLLSLQQFVGNPEGQIDWKVIGLAGAIAIASYIGNEFRGKGVTVAGLLGVAGSAFATIQTTGTFTWNQFGLSVLVGFLALVAPPPKPASYEETDTIKGAKEEAKVITATEKETASDKTFLSQTPKTQ